VSSIEKSPHEPFFQIHDPEINVEEIMEDIESKLKSRDISKEDVERISKLRLSPFSKNSVREFDASLSANLFEKGISPPKFTNPKLWFFKGPLRWMLSKFVDFYALVDKKLSENRVRAFFQLLHEVVILKKRQDLLGQKLDEFYQEYSNNKYIAAKGLHQSTVYSPLSIRVDFESGYPPESEDLINLIKDCQPILILYPANLGFLEFCNNYLLKYRVVTPYPEDVNLIKRTITEFVTTQERISPNNSVLFHANACLFPSGFWEGTLRQWRSIEQETKFFIRYRDRSNYNLSPFTDNLPLQIDSNQLVEYLRKLGFKNVTIHPINSYGWINISFMNFPS
jgi:hypothetical protein